MHKIEFLSHYMYIRVLVRMSVKLFSLVVIFQLFHHPLPICLHMSLKDLQD